METTRQPGMTGGVLRVAGFGHNSRADIRALADALERAGGKVGMLAALEGRAGLVGALAGRLGLPLRVVDPGTARAQPCLSDSAAARAATGLASVAEAVALGALPGGCLLAPRVISADGTATCAIAWRHAPPHEDSLP